LTTFVNTSIFYNKMQKLISTWRTKCNMKLTKMVAKIEKSWREVDVDLQYVICIVCHCLDVTTNLLCKVHVVFMFIRMTMHSLGSCKRILSITVYIFNKVNNLFINIFLEEETIHNHLLLWMFLQWLVPLPPILLYLNPLDFFCGNAIE